ncbi:hypothetical protein MCOR25_007361 [Pyricularia grisea]|nr:hypothetical protein MCOR25_007361 [Pyricularia grisea]
MAQPQQPPPGNMTGGGPPPPGRMPGNFIVFGPRANCTLDLCPVEMSVYGYRPSLAANGAFIALFTIAAMIHAYLGIRWRSWWFMSCMVTGCFVITLGYIGRIMLYYNPWSFAGFMMQIILVGSGPVWFCGAIYVTLSKTVTFLSPAYSRIPPRLYIWIFIPCDAIALILQAAGGALSTTSSGASQVGVDMGIAGLAFQVATMTIFSTAMVDYMVRYLRSPTARADGSIVQVLGVRLRLFFVGLASATVLILGRSAYRVEELSKGYSGPSIRNETLFIWLEGVVIVVATYLLCIGHPGIVFSKCRQGRPESTDKIAMSNVRLSSRSPENRV